MIYKSDLQVLALGEVVRIVKSKKNGDPIAYADDGRVILFSNKNDLHFGFGRIKSFTERKKCFIATAENCIYDYYRGSTTEETIPLDELHKVLEDCFGFTKEYEVPIDDSNIFEVWANLFTGDLVTIETWNHGNDRSYNSINVTIPFDGSNLLTRYDDRLGFSHGGGGTRTYNLVFSEVTYPLSAVLSKSSQSRNWKGSTPSLWHYGDEDNKLLSRSLRRIYDFKDDIPSLFNMNIEKHLLALEEIGH